MSLESTLGNLKKIGALTPHTAPVVGHKLLSNFTLNPGVHRSEQVADQNQVDLGSREQRTFCIPEQKDLAAQNRSGRLDSWRSPIHHQTESVALFGPDTSAPS